MAFENQPFFFIFYPEVKTVLLCYLLLNLATWSVSLNCRYFCFCRLLMDQDHLTNTRFFWCLTSLLLLLCWLPPDTPPKKHNQYLTPGALLRGEAIKTGAFGVLEASQCAGQSFKPYVVLLLQWLGPGCFLLEAFEMLIIFPSPLSCVCPPDPSSNYIRQLETKVRILEDDNKLLSQVSCTHSET